MGLGLKLFRPRARWLARFSMAAGLMAATAAASAHDTQTRWTRVNAGCYGAMDYDLGAVDCDGRASGHGGGKISGLSASSAPWSGHCPSNRRLRV